jgi:hypothetical protein
MTDVFRDPGRARHEESLVAVAYHWCHLVRQPSFPGCEMAQ